jgi:glycerol-3-phosphate dehydrogenase
VHMDDLLLRRVRLGLLLPEGGIPLLPQIRQVVQAELGWEDDCWQQETAAYARLWCSAYSLPTLVSTTEIMRPKAHHQE